MKKNNGNRRNSFIITIMFIAFIGIVFALNIFESATNIIQKKEINVREIVNGFEKVEHITYPFININGLFQNVMQRDYLYDADSDKDSIRNKDNLLVSAHTDYSREKLDAAAGRLSETNQWLKSQGIPLIYVQAAGKLTFTDEDALPGIKNQQHDKINRMLDNLNKSGVECLDTRDILSGEEKDNFYKTDHHWTTEAALKVANGVCEHLNATHDLGIDTDKLKESNFDKTVYENSFLGAEGRRTGRYYVGLDDFTVLTPQYDTDFTVEISDKEGKHFSRRGAFNESVMDISKDPSKYSFETSSYYVYMGGDYGRFHVQNNNTDSDKSVMIIKDSFGVPVSSFMCNAFKNIDIIDVRYYVDDKPLSTLIKESKPDAVIYVYGTGYLTKKKMFTIK